MDTKTKEKRERGGKFYGEYKGKPPFCADSGLCHRAFDYDAWCGDFG
jgi:hypothetical protein